MAAVPVRLRAQTLTGTAAFQAAAFPATGPRIPLRAFPANCQAPPMRRQDGGVPSQAPRASADWDRRLPCAAKMAAVPVRLRAQALTGTAAFQAAAFPATGPQNKGRGIAAAPLVRAIGLSAVGFCLSPALRGSARPCRTCRPKRPTRHSSKSRGRSTPSSGACRCTPCRPAW